MPPTRRSTRTASTTAAHQSAQPYRTNHPRSPAPTPSSSASIARPANGKTSLRLTVKAPPSKLRQATSGSQIGSAPPIPPNPYADHASESEADATPAPAVRAPRSTGNVRTVVEPESDEDEEEESEGEQDVDMEEAGGGDVDRELLAHEDSEEDDEEEEEEEGDDEDAEGEDDDEMDEHPPPPIITQQRPVGTNKPNVTVSAPPEGPLKSVEAKEMEDDEDEELSELDSNEGEGDEEEEDSDDNSDNSRSATPDLSKLTRRQRGLYDETADAGLMALSNEALKKKHLTAEEHAMRRAEMARRRKNLSEKRNEEEKVLPLSLPFP